MVAHALTYDPFLARENTWRLSASSPAIEARIRVASAQEVSIEVPVRRSAATGRRDGRAYLRCLDGDNWLVLGGAGWHQDLPRLELALARGPQAVQMRLWAIP